MTDSQALRQLEPEELIARARRDPARASLYLEILYEGLYPRVAGWCLRLCRDREEAAELAQEVFLRVHTKLDSYRLESKFSTWLYTVTRRVAIDRGLAAQRRERPLVDEDRVPEAADSDAAVDDHLAREQVLERLAQAMERDLEPLEARVVYLHYVDGLSLPAITQLLDLDNKSGAKAYIVGGIRKLKRQFGPWLQRERGSA